MNRNDCDCGEQPEHPWMAHCPRCNEIVARWVSGVCGPCYAELTPLIEARARQTVRMAPESMPADIRARIESA